MPTFRHGKNTVVLANGYNVSTWFKEATTNINVDTAETTAFGSSAKTYLASMEDGTLSLKGMFDGTTSAVDDIFTALITASTNPVITVAMDGATVGSNAHIVGAIETSYEVSSPVADIVSVSADFQADGGLDSGKLLTVNTTIATATTTLGTAVDNGAATSNGGAGHVHVTANTRSATTTLKIQHSTDNSTWVDLVTFTGVLTNITSGERIVVAAGTTVNRYLRSNITTSGSGSITTSIAFARR
jgi:hypothetical protein